MVVHLEINKVHKAILKEFGTVVAAADVLAMQAKTLYTVIHGTATEGTLKRIKACGYSAVTFKRLK